MIVPMAPGCYYSHTVRQAVDMPLWAVHLLTKPHAINTERSQARSVFRESPTS
jgi:hypothetical protein